VFDGYFEYECACLPKAYQRVRKTRAAIGFGHLGLVAHQIVLIGGGVDTAHHLVGLIEEILADGVGGLFVLAVLFQNKVAAVIVRAGGVGLPTVIALSSELVRFYGSPAWAGRPGSGWFWVTICSFSANRQTRGERAVPVFSDPSLILKRAC